MTLLILILITGAVPQVTAAPPTQIKANNLQPTHGVSTVFHDTIETFERIKPRVGIGGSDTHTDTIETFERIKPIAPRLVNSIHIPVFIPACVGCLSPPIKSPRRGLFWQTIKSGQFWRIFALLSLIAVGGAALVGLIGLAIAALFKAATSSVFWICFGIAGSLFVLIAFGIAFLAMNLA